MQLRNELKYLKKENTNRIPIPIEMPIEIPSKIPIEMLSYTCENSYVQNFNQHRMQT